MTLQVSPTSLDVSIQRFVHSALEAVWLRCATAYIMLVLSIRLW